MKTKVGILLIAYLSIGLVFALYAWSREVRTFECGDVVIQHTYNFTTGTGSFENPDPERCVRRGFDGRSIATIPYFTVAWPIVIGGQMLNNSQQEVEDSISQKLDISENHIPEGWYQRRGEGFNNLYAVLTRDPNVPWPQYELGELGDHIIVNMIEIDEEPETWMKEYVQCDDVLVKSCTWDFVNGRRHLRVEHSTPAADARSDYFLNYDRVAYSTLYPLDSDTKTKTAYSRFLYNVVAPLVDTTYSRDVLHENCTQEIPRELIDDSTTDYENKVVTMFWWDGEFQEDQSLSVPYEPEADFEGCSESVKEFLRHLPNPEDKT